MATAVNYTPLQLRFGGVLPDTVGPDISTFGGDLPNPAGGVVFDEAPVAANVTAAIVGDTTHFAVRDVYVLEWVDEVIRKGPPPPGEGPPGRQSLLVQPKNLPTTRMLEVADSITGPGTISVGVGQKLLVRVVYSALSVEGGYGASLLITSDAWNPVTVPLSLFLANVVTTASDTLEIAQGSRASLAFHLTSVMGPAVDVSFAMSTTQLHTGLRLLDTASTHLESKEQKNFLLTFQADPDAPLGGNDVALEQVAFRPMGFFFRANIRHAQITVNAGASDKLRPLAKNVRVEIPINISLNGGSAAEVDFVGVGLPQGATLSPQSVFVQADQTIQLDLYLGANAPNQFDFSVNWSAFAGEQRGTLLYHLIVPQPIVFTGNIETGGLAALGGAISVTINPDGSTRWQGHAHDSGADGYEFTIAAFVKAPASGRVVAFAHSGSVGGTFTSGSRDNDWDEFGPANDPIASVFDDLAAGHFGSHLEYTSDIGSALEGMLNFIIKFAAGTVLGPGVGAVIFVGFEVGSLLGTGSLVPGARIVEGILWMAGPANTLFAIVAEGIAFVGSRTRDIEQEWYDWANNHVFNGSLPARDSIVLTDTIGGGNPPRPFTFPRYDGKITLNMGPDAFDDPRNYGVSSGRLKSGEVFIHELVHACQIAHTRNLNFIGEALSVKLCEAAGNPYLYGLPNQDYTELNIEQQAQIVQDWFAGNKTLFGQTGKAEDRTSPFFHYLPDNVWVGVF
jgi:hypothetical protein